MQIEETQLKGLYVISPKLISDERGFFMEAIRRDEFEKAGLPTRFVQVNHTSSKQHVLRGLHFQWDKPLGKVIRVIKGSAFMAFVDIRKKSETLGRSFLIEVSEDNKKIIYAPPGFAAGFCVPGDIAQVEYFYTEFYNPKGESSILWNDPEVAIPWPVINPILSQRDKNAETLDTWLKRPESDSF